MIAIYLKLFNAQSHKTAIYHIYANLSFTIQNLHTYIDYNIILHIYYKKVQTDSMLNPENYYTFYVLYFYQKIVKNIIIKLVLLLFDI